MFIKVVRRGLEDRNNVSVFQCRAYHVHPVEDKETEWAVTMENSYGLGPATSFTYSTAEEGLGIFVMNDEGQTVETMFRSK